jgi:aryl-alcohol dehydrogenase-like predicted oxidoreductase
MIASRAPASQATSSRIAGRHHFGITGRLRRNLQAAVAAKRERLAERGPLRDSSRPGKVRYIGASSMHAWQFARALGIVEKNAWTRFVSMQNLVNLLYREEEREMLPLCEAEGIGVIPWSPQARGKLSRDWGYTGMRTETDEAITRLFAKTQEADKRVVDRVAEVANARGIPRVQVALAWLLAKPVITAPIVGATKLHHLDDALASVAV